MVHLQHEDLLHAVRVSLVRRLPVRLRSRFPHLSEVDAPVWRIRPAVRVPPQALVARPHLGERPSGIVGHRDIRGELDIECNIHVLATRGDDEDRLVVVAQGAVHRERPGP